MIYDIAVGYQSDEHNRVSFREETTFVTNDDGRCLGKVSEDDEEGGVTRVDTR